jgi:hypothetical protein
MPNIECLYEREREREFVFFVCEGLLRNLGQPSTILRKALKRRSFKTSLVIEQSIENSFFPLLPPPLLLLLDPSIDYWESHSACF